MKVLQKHKFTLATILLALICVLSLSFGAYSAFADRTVTIDGTSYFYANSGAEVRAYLDVEDDASTEDDESEYYVMFHMIDDSNNVTYRYNLAYNWWQASETDEAVGVEGWFNMTIGFANDNFDRYTIKFQSQQYAKTEDGVTTNYVVFVSDGNGNVTVYVTDDEDMLEVDVTEISEAKTFPVDNGGSVNKLTIEFTGYDLGTYYVKISDDAGSEAFTGELLNIGNTYAKRVNSTTAGVMPLTFAATFGDGQETCDMVLYNLNGQSFKYTSASSVTSGDETYYTGTTVTDDCPPVLCISGDLRYLEYGEELDFDYVVIDVLASSPSSTIHYYVLSASIYDDAASSAETNYFTDDTTVLSSGNSLFDKTSDSDDYLLIDSADAFLTQAVIDANDSGENGYTVGCLVKVYLEIKDVTSSLGYNATTNVFLDWYIDSSYLVSVTAGGNTSDFIMAVSDEQGATYVSNYDGSGNYTGDLDALAEQYQKEIDALALDENGDIALSAGSSSNFYLPAYTGFVTDNLEGYEDLKYSIYYTIDGDESSTSSLSYNNMSISLSSAGTYKFTIYVTDSASNNMYYIDKDTGELVEFEASEIYDDDIAEYLPWFSFKVIYTGATIDDPGEQTTGYVDTAYTSISFDINGVSSYYDTSYSLYIFDRAGFLEDYSDRLEELGITFDYSEYCENLEALFTSTYITDNGGEYINTRSYFKTIKELSSLNETDEDYDDYCDYEWDSSSLSFVPQDENSYYLVRLTVTDSYIHQAAVYGYMGIHVSAAANSYSGESDWVSNNIASIVLFSIAGAALIGIIVLFIIKPKDSGDIDEQLAKEEGKGKKKKSKKAE